MRNVERQEMAGTQRIATGAGWLYGYRWVERGIDFVSLVILARILSAEDFGLVAIAASFAAILEGLAAFDVDKALIRAREDERPLYDTAWTLSTLRGFVAALGMVAATAFLTDPRVASALLVLTLGPIAKGLSNPSFVGFERDLIYSKLATLTLGAKIVSFGATLVVALLYRSYWALVIGILAGALTSTALSYVLKPYRPRVSFARFSDIFAFSGWLSLTSVVTTLSMETDKIIVGRLLGVIETGHYYMTQRVGVLPTRELVSPLQRILFPSFSERAHDRERLRRSALESVNVLGTLSLPAGCGFALIANDFVPLALGDSWKSLVPLLVVLVPYLGLRATLSMALPCVMALGRTQLLFWVSLAYALVHIPAFVAGTMLFGLPGSIYSIVAAGALYIGLNAWMLHRTLTIVPGELIAQLFRPLVATATMVGVVLILDAFISLELFSESGSWLSLAIKLILGALVFLSTQYWLWSAQGRPAGVERRLAQLAKQ